MRDMDGGEIGTLRFDNQPECIGKAYDCACVIRLPSVDFSCLASLPSSAFCAASLRLMVPDGLGLGRNFQKNREKIEVKEAGYFNELAAFSTTT